MSKLYAMNRMMGSPAAGDIFSSALKLGGGIVKGVASVFKSKAAGTAVAAAKTAIKNPRVQAALAAGAGGLAGALLTPGGGGGASGSWRRYRRKGITGAELRGFHKVARLLHKEGMVVKHARRGK